MARVYIITKSITSKHPKRCEKCGKAINPPEGYKWTKPKTSAYGGHKRIRCLTCPNWTLAETSTSKMAEIWDAQNSWDSSEAEDQSAAEALRDDFVTIVRNVAEEYRTSQQNMEDGFGHPTANSDELGERADGLDSWADEIEGVSIPDTDDYLEECPECNGAKDCPECEGSGVDPEHRFADGENAQECPHCEGSKECPGCQGSGNTGEVDLDAWRNDWQQELDDLIQNCPVG